MTAGQRKGTQWQRDVNTWLAARGWTTSRRSIGESGDDITAARGPHRLSVEVKNRRDISPAEFLDQAIGNAGPGQTPVVIIKRRGRADPGEAYALLRVADFNALLEEGGNGNGHRWGAGGAGGGGGPLAEGDGAAVRGGAGDGAGAPQRGGGDVQRPGRRAGVRRRFPVVADRRR